jgi:hypothetical protein
MHRATPGITPQKLTEDPLGTEGEMTPGPDDYNPYEDHTERHDPTEGHDPFIFDDIEPRLPDPPSHRLDAELPGPF